MDQWLDSLSEDWVSQPTSPRSTSSKQTSVLRDAPSPSSNGSQSRIPRYKPRSASNLSTASLKEIGLGSSLRRVNSNEAALKEKTSSNLNASRNRMPNGQGPGSASRKALGRHVSTGSIPVVPQDTVQVRVSPAKIIDGHATPDWKRRVLKENLGKGDLFSPIGLENMFRPPTLGPKRKGKPAVVKKKPSKKEDLPSSPPAYPALTSQNPNTPASKTKELTMASPPQSARSGKNDSRHLVPQEIEMPSTNDRRAERPFNANVKPADPEPRSDEDAGRILALPTAPTPPQRVPYDRPSTRSRSNDANHSMISSVPGKTSDENISPFFVSRHNTVDGHVEYAAIDMSMRRLRAQMDKLRMQQQNIPSSRSSDHEISYANSRLSDKAPFLEHVDELTSQSLPDDLSMGTDAYAANGGFVSIHRGGYSNDGSFQRRPLSPSLLQDLDGPSMKSQTSITHNAMPSPQLPKMFSQTKSSTPSSPPKTPKHQKTDSAGSHERPRSSGSPLKLFDKYDTFTNDKLARRMSKFEETMQQEMQDDSSAKSVNARSSPSPGPKRRLQRSQHRRDENVEKGRRICSFGSNDLDDHNFPACEMQMSDLQDADTLDLPKMDSSNLRSQRSHLNRSNGSNARSGRKISDTRKKHVADTLEKYHEDGSRNARLKSNKERHHQFELRQHDVLQNSTGKRLPYSPAKDPAPKRRRTLRDSEEIEKDIAQLRQQLETRKSPVSMTGRKRKDALYETNTQVADPKILAMRQIRQPKLPASSPANSPAQNMTAKESGHPTDPSQVLAQTQDEGSAVDPPTQIVAGALATVALNTVQDLTYGSRKASVTTADFFNEAQQIMQLIRNQGRPRSSQATADASEVGQPTIAEESVVEESTKDEFSRPPSREGGSPPRLRNPAQTDARVISHLRKFEDQETLGLALSSSLKTLQISQAGMASESCAQKDREPEFHNGTESDPPNIRIRESDVQSYKPNYTSLTRNPSISESDRHVQSKDSRPSSGPSTSRTDPTGSSHSSTKRLVIAPQTVAHLLSDQMAGMVFDRQKQLWIKRKGSANSEHNNDHTVSDETEEDLFGDIPDLSVDEMEELQRVKESISSIKSAGTVTDEVSRHDQAIINEAIAKVEEAAEAFRDARPTTAEGKTIEAADDNSAPSKHSHFAWSGPQPGTRATSWGEEALPSTEGKPGLSTSPSDQHEAEVEHEISILEGRESRVPKHRSSAHRQARVVTVAFSSPLVDQREPAHKGDDDDDELDLWEEQSELNLDASPVRQNYQPRTSSRRDSFGVMQKASRRVTSRRLSFSNQSFHARPMSRLDEQDEMSLVQYSSTVRPMTLQVEVSTPLPVSRSLIIPQTTGNRSSVSFHLSPLPDFTVHQIDKPLDGELGQVTRRPKQFRANQVDNRLSLAAQDLVKNLTDVEPYEPYWEYIRSVDLHDRGIKTLHMLDEFCGGIEELDVSDNKIGELNGVPNSVRQLNIRGNCLSDLAAWNTLYNLQYMDVSENNLHSVKGLHSLVHLRSLRADHNEIRNLNGLEDLDGLISLSLRDNMLRAVDFKNFNLYVFT